MPIVPEFTQGISTAVEGPGFTPTGAGAVGQAIAEGAGMVADATLKLYNQIQDEQSKSDANTLNLSHRIQMEEYSQRLQQNTRGGYVYDEQGKPVFSGDTPLTYSQAVKEHANTLYRQGQDAQANGLGQRYYKQYAEPDFARDVLKATQFEYESRYKDSVVQLDAALLERIANLDKGATPDAIYKTLEDVQKSIMNAPYLDFESKQKKIQAASSETVVRGVKAGIDGYLLAPTGGRPQFLDDWLSFLNGTDASSIHQSTKANTHLTPAQRSALEHEIVTLKTVGVGVSKTEINAKKRDALADLSSGDPTRMRNGESLAAQVLSAQRQLSVGGHESTAVINDTKATLGYSRKIGELRSSAAFVTMSPTARQTYAQDLMSKGLVGQLGGAARSAAEAEMSAMLAGLDKQEKSDFFAYSTAISPPQSAARIASGLPWADPARLPTDGASANAVLESVIQAQSLYEQHNGSDYSTFKVTSKENAQRVSRALTLINGEEDNTNIAHKVEGIRNLKRLYGPYYPDLMNQLVHTPPLEGDAKLPASWKSTIAATSDDQLQSVVEGLVHPAGKDDRVKQYEAAHPGVVDQVKQAIYSKYYGKINAFLARDPNAADMRTEAQDLSNAIYDKSLRLLTLPNTGVTSAADAVTRAGSSLVDSNGTLIRGIPNGSGRYDFWGPPQLSLEEQAQMTAFFREKLKKPNALDIQIPGYPNGYAQAGESVGVAQQRYSLDWMRNLINTGVWTMARPTARDTFQEGVTLWYRTPDGLFRRVESNQQPQYTAKEKAQNPSLTATPVFFSIPLNEVQYEGAKLLKVAPPIEPTIKGAK